MSTPNKWAWVWSQRVRPNEKLVLLDIADRMGRNQLSWSIDQREIADRCGLSVDTVQRSVRRLEQLGVITRQRRTTRYGHRLPDQYTLCLDAAGAEAPKPQIAAQAEGSLSRNDPTPIPPPAACHKNSTPLSQPNGGESAPQRKVGSRRRALGGRAKSTLPLDWTLPAEGRVYARTRRVMTEHDVDREVERFRDHHVSKADTSADWLASWRTWINHDLCRFPRRDDQVDAGGLPDARERSKRAAVESWARTRVWPLPVRQEWGPAPDEPDTRIPVEVREAALRKVAAAKPPPTSPNINYGKGPPTSAALPLLQHNQTLQ